MTPDGRTVIFHSFTRSLQSLRLDGHEPITLVETPVEERNGELSPDGRWLAYEGKARRFPGSSTSTCGRFPDVNRAVWQVTRDGGTFPLWSRNGRELFYVAPDGTIVAVPVDASGTTWKAGTSEGALSRAATPLATAASDGRTMLLPMAGF